ncbi:hypothetical protein I6F07_13835 [Ensifer sp. IC4062]|nr:hypothetical protein [Ensifer sp. IC4062]MCA1441274.1 hypothetical protein [Ensifer sp. IC4062]
MARDINKRLTQLRTRRGGLDRLNRVNESLAVDTILRKSQQQEPWEKRALNKPNTRYALGAMQAVDSDYTRISIETAERVANQLKNGLNAHGDNVEFRLQGSVPLDIHIRGVSDVDLLTLSTDFYTYDRTGQRSQLGFYTSPSSRTSIGVLLDLRGACENILISSFPKAEVDTTGGKAIAISGGSLARPVDVVPSHWFDTTAYQVSGQEHDRAVTILNKKVPTTLDNWPFLHIKKINDVDEAVSGGLKKAIRLCKNVRSDAEAEGTSIPLPSFDIAATMYHADYQALSQGSIYELAILAEAQRHLDHLVRNIEHAKALRVPDGSRRIFDSDDKIRGLHNLSNEIDDLLREVAKEQNNFLASLAEPPLDASRIAISLLNATGLS